MQPTRTESFCPLHEFERNECDHACVALHKEFRRITHAFNSYWHDRIVKGVPYVSLAEQRRCRACHKWYVPRRANQGFCTIVCHRRMQWVKYSGKLKRAA
jgi:hypothetical protein